jgi:alkylation response protein AidB-like acyl-CoA dehydrogenase
MDLHLTDEQEPLVDTLSAIYARDSSPERVRAVEPHGFDKALWSQLLDLGIIAMALDEGAGGWGAVPTRMGG